MSELIEQKAYSLLERTRCIALPIDVFEIARRCRYNVKSYSKCKKLIEKLGLYEYVKTRPAFTIKYINSYFILISDTLSVDSERKAIAHEIGHIILHKIENQNIINEQYNVSMYDNDEKEAEEFALKLLAPLPILSSYHIETPEDIKKITGLSLLDCETIYNDLIDYHDERFNMFKCEKIAILHRRHLKRTGDVLKITTLICCFICIVFSLSIICSSTFQKSIVPQSKSNFTMNSDISSLNENDIYFWTDSGNCFHTHKDCQSLKNSSEIHSGTLSDAKDEKERLCKFCENRDKEDDK